MFKPILKLSLSTLFILALSSACFGQDFDIDCRPLGFLPACQPIAASIAALEAGYDDRIATLQAQLQGASTSVKASIIRRIREIEQERDGDPELSRLRSALQTCQQQDTRQRRPLATNVLNANLRGTVTVTTTHPLASGEFRQNINLGLQFSRSRCNVTVTSFPPLIFTAPPPPGGGSVTATVTQTGGGVGQFFPITGQLFLPITLQLAYSVVFADRDTAAITFTTGTSISPRATFALRGARLSVSNLSPPDLSPVDRCGLTVRGTTTRCTLTLVGTTLFQNGFLGGQEGGFTVQGDLTVVQPPSQPSQTRQQCLTQCDEAYRLCMDSAVDGRPSPTQCATGRSRCKASCPAR